MLKKAGLGLTKRLMEPINPSLIALLGAYTTLWGLWLLSPWWNVFTQAPLYSKMDAFPEWFWGLIAIFSGFEILRGVVRNRNRDLRRGAAVGWVHWLLITIMYFWGDWRNTGGVTSLTIALYCFVVFLNFYMNPDHPPE